MGLAWESVHPLLLDSDRKEGQWVVREVSERIDVVVEVARSLTWCGGVKLPLKGEVANAKKLIRKEGATINVRLRG